jgi:uncharacterized membrane protein YgcG
MDTFKRSAALSASLLLLGSLALLAEPHRSTFDNRVLNDVVEMTNAEIPDASVLAYVRTRRAVLEQDVTSGDLARLRRAGVSEDVVAYIAHVADLNDNGQNQDWGRNHDQALEYDGGTSYEGGVTSYDGDGHYVYDYGGYPYWYAYAPFYGYGYGPYWYGYGAYYGGYHWHDHGHGHDGHGHDGHGHGGHGWNGGGGHHGGSHGGGSHGGHSGGHSGGGHSGGSHGGGSHGGGGGHGGHR